VECDIYQLVALPREWLLMKGQLLAAMQPRVLQMRAGNTVENGDTDAEGS
jgi:hypothetical protein